jgi:hypothetical protein
MQAKLVGVTGAAASGVESSDSLALVNEPLLH